MIIQTPRLRLRPWAEADRGAFAALHADPLVMVDAPRPLTREKSDRKFDRYADAFDRLGVCNWAVETLDGEVIGYAGVMPARDSHPLGEHYAAGWRFARQAWGQGYATEASRAALGDALARLRLPEVLAYTAPVNVRSQGVMTRLGLRRDPIRDFTLTDANGVYTGLVWIAEPA